MRSAPPWPKWLPWFLAGLVLFQIVVLCTSPIKDGDIFFQMMYGKTALEEKTLVADHSRYTWSSATNENLYCNWFSQIFFYLSYSIGGFPALYAFKYILALIFFGLLLHLAKLTGLLRSPMMWAFGIVSLSLSNHSGIVIKPEGFSFLGITLFCYLWVRMRLSSNPQSRLPYFYPLIMAIWVNSHGGFIFGAAFLFLIWLGEEMNVRFCPKEALPRGTRKHFFIACVLSAGALLANPHGIEYPTFIVKGLLGANVDELRVVSDYSFAFSFQGSRINLPSFFFIALALLTLAMRDPFREKRLNWAVILPNLLFAFLLCYMLRTAYFWGVIFSFTGLYLLEESPSILEPRAKWARLTQAILPAGFALTFSLVLLYQKTYEPVVNRWFGYGMSMRNPQEEAEYIREHYSGLKLGNDYDTGAYLMWTLYPDQKHMIDARYFPFKDWFAVYHNAFGGNGTQKFVDEVNCDIWCIGFQHKEAIDWFRNSKDWKTLFYGQTAAIFGREDLEIDPASPLGGDSIENVRVLGWAAYLLAFAVNIADWEGAFRIYEGAVRNFSSGRALEDARRFLEGTLSYLVHDFAVAAERLTPPEGGSILRDDGILLNSYLHTTVDQWNKNEREAAFTYAQATIFIAPNDLMAHFNYGVMAAYLEAVGQPFQKVEGAPGWRQSLQLYVDNFDKVENLPKESLALARKALKERLHEKPELIEPAKPDREEIDFYRDLLQKLN